MVNIKAAEIEISSTPLMNQAPKALAPTFPIMQFDSVSSLYHQSHKIIIIIIQTHPLILTLSLQVYCMYV